MKFETTTRALAAASGPLSRGPGYRPDIDGLRALAVMLVVLNHAGVAWVAGGFVGVDVFFVISGFLITGIIAGQRARGEFRFGDFYLRRARRLLPALYVLLLVVTAAGYTVLTPADYSLLAQGALSAIALVSNVFFARTSGGYFAPEAEALPLLHLWSLSVEEQFYLLWPAGLLLLLKLKSRAVMTLAVGLLAAASFAYGHYEAGRHPADAYFFLAPRAGEFLAGALAWLLWRQDRAPSAWIANVLSGGGLLLISAAAAMFSAGTRFPGMAALVPCLGAAALVSAPQFGPSLVSRALCLRPVVFVGLISYSVYLWHWPIVSVLRYQDIAITPAVSTVIVAASLVCGYLSWRLLETGFRGLLERRPARGLPLAATGLAVALAAPAYIHLKSGLPERFPYALLTQGELTAERNRYWQGFPVRPFAQPAPGGPKVLIVGNSHGFDLGYALIENGFEGRLEILETFHQCFNFGHDPVTPANAELCAERRRAVLGSSQLKAADIVLLHDNWGGYDARGLAEMIGAVREVSDAPIYIVGPKMTFTDDALSISKRAQDRRHATVAGVNAFALGYQEVAKVERDRALKALFAHPAWRDVRYVSLLDLQCGPRRRCEILGPDGRYLYFDAGHFTLEGSRRVGVRLKQAHPELFRRTAS
ncbi:MULTISPECIES: acyltransferase family protein [unclassified Phenylobacterium]|uniref:acyltransferase family protein n=1 Tax=unclassified Phenylobacterium TaxID=2640670 RepID=UPI00083A1060|nr:MULTISPECIES: acyltransferase family protein [unclassified Phenylobacterium]